MDLFVVRIVIMGCLLEMLLVVVFTYRLEMCLGNVGVGVSVFCLV